VQDEMKARDLSDSTRATSPLAIAQDAVNVDTTGLGVDEVVEQVMKIVDESRRHGRGVETL